MPIYLPIAETSLDLFLLLLMGGGVGVLSGLFGVGGGFLMTPLLIFSGIPAPVAVATEANQVAGASVSGTLAYWRRSAVDFKLGSVMILGGAAGALAGVFIFSAFRAAGQLDLVIRLCYVLFMGCIGSLMLLETARAFIRLAAGLPPTRRRPGQHNWIHGLPLRLRFTRARIYISAAPVLLLGALAGVLSAIMGVGGGFLLVPAMIYLLRVPTNIAIGTSLFQIIFITSLTTVLHAVENVAVDLMLAVPLVISAAAGAQLGARAATRLRPEMLRGLLALLVLAVAGQLALSLVLQPDDVFSLALPFALPLDLPVEIP